MAKQKDKNSRDSSNKKNTTTTYTLKPKDVRFLEMLAIIIEANRKAKVRPDSVNAISEMVFGERTLISKIKNAKRGISKTMMQKFANYFNINPNAFFQDTLTMDYNPQNISGQVSVKGKAIAVSGDQATITQIKGNSNTVDNVGNTIHKGNIYKINKIGRLIQKAENIINTTSTGKNKELWDGIVATIKQETQLLETTIVKQHEDIKKMEKLYHAQLQAEIEKRKKAERERDEAREEERKILKKYLKLIEQKD